MHRLLVPALVAALALPALGQTMFPQDPRSAVKIDQKIGQKIPLNLEFRDETGKVVHLRDYFGKKPVILTPVYYDCPMLCNLVLDGVVKAASDLKLNIGEDYEIVSVSFNPRETPKDAAAKKLTYTRRYGRTGVDKGWHFLTGDQLQIRQLMDSIGFHYAWDPALKQYAHGAMIAVLTPDGTLSRYFYGFEFKPRDLRFALVQSSDGKIGTVVDQVLLLCYCYDPATGKYSRSAMNAVRVGGTLTAVGVFGFIFLMLKRERKRRS